MVWYGNLAVSLRPFPQRGTAAVSVIVLQSTPWIQLLSYRQWGIKAELAACIGQRNTCVVGNHMHGSDRKAPEISEYADTFRCVISHS